MSLAALPLAQADPVKPPRLSAAAITSTLNEEVHTPGTAWMTRPDGKVLVSYDSTVTGAKLTALTNVTKKLAGNKKKSGSSSSGGEVKAPATKERKDSIKLGGGDNPLGDL